MKARAFLQNITRTESGCLLIFDTRANPEAMTELIGEELTLDIKTGKDRTLSQNSLLWALIGAIDQKQNGRKSEEGSTEIYKQIIKMAKIKTVFLQTLAETLPMLERNFRVVVDRGKRTNENGVEMVVFECYIGSSQFDTKEMSDTIETALDYAERSGVDTAYYRDEWKGLLNEKTNKQEDKV